MFEVWENTADPTLWLVFRESPSFPGDFAADEWSELGSCRVADHVAAHVERVGYVMMEAIIPFDPDGTLGDGRTVLLNI